MNNNYYKKYYENDDDEDVSPNVCDEEIAPSPENSQCSAKEPIIALLSELCHSKVLNVDYLLGLSSQPFEAKPKKSKAKRRRNHRMRGLKLGMQWKKGGALH